ncbi:hypothetical protein EB75_19635 [Mycobacterium sp. ST-F2]|nr:hypothetical protein EB75_19635 [Mycobacterium sp. ST-F2]
MIQIGVVVTALLIRCVTPGWFLMIAAAISVASLGLFPAAVFGTLIWAGFAAPPAAVPLIVAADVLLIASALMLPDGGDLKRQTPILRFSKATGRVESAVNTCGIWAGIAYLLTLPGLAWWTLAS